MKLSNSVQMREIDEYAINDLGISGVLLMANAANHLAMAAMERLPARDARAAVFCGTGNNGGDGIDAAAILIERGVHTRVFLVGSVDKLTADSKEMLQKLQVQGGDLELFSETPDIGAFLSECDVVIDAIFGIGLNSDLRGDALAAVNLINDSRARCISADIPTGVSADSGRILGAAVRADVTVTFSRAKIGHFVEPSCVFTGELRICDIGIPREIIDSAPSDSHAVMPEDISLPRRNPLTHKGDYGRVLILAGSVGYTGAPVLSARAASRTGAGLVSVAVPGDIYPIIAATLDEEMPFPLTGVDNLLSRADSCDALLIGPGLGSSPDVANTVRTMLANVKTPVILDADGINAICGNIDILDNAACPLILTPHPGEFARLGGDLSHGDRVGEARQFATAHNCILILKGHRTITTLPDGSAYINTTGGPAMAKGGSGDVLSGMIAALIGQKFPLKDAVLAAVYIHGLAGDICADRLGEYSVTAGDVIAALPEAVKRVMEI
ncbi:MAG: NAD(P)H-hydrate dehydratase [Oscillospiraceae bacterium]|nr:NAD(P)H-hydrate dehydratase [Oscillospiraceae bacterium]